MAESSENRVTPSRNFWIVGAILCAATLLTFQGVLQLEFLEYDDNDYVLHNPLIYPISGEKIVGIFTRTYFRSYTPLAHLSHAVDFALWGRDPFGHHLTNLILHLANAALLYVLLILLLAIWIGKRGPSEEPPPEGGGSLRAILVDSPFPHLIAAGAGSALFALHPLRVESVAWISDRKDLLMTTCVLISIVAYLLFARGRGTPAGRKWFLLSLSAGILGMLAKTVGSMLPLVLLMLDAFVVPSDGVKGEGLPRLRGWIQLLLEKWGFFLGSLFVGIMSILALAQVRRHPSVYVESIPEKFLLPFYSWAFYLGKTLFPVDLNPIYIYPPFWQQVLSLVAVGALTFLAIWWYRRKSPLLVLTWGFFLLFLVPTILGREKAGIQPWADRYSYLPSVAIGVLFCALVFWIVNRERGWLRRLGMAATLGLLVGCGIHSALLVPKWHDTERLFRHAAAVNPRAIFAQANLGLILTSVGKPDEALEVLRQASELSPSYAGSYGAMGLAYELRGEPERAAEMYRKALSLDTNYVDAHSNLGNALITMGRFDEAIREYLEAIRKEPEFDDAYYNMGIALYRKGDPAAALETFRLAAGVNPIRPDTYVNMGIIYEGWGKVDSAYALYARAAALGHAKAAEKIRQK